MKDRFNQSKPEELPAELPTSVLRLRLFALFALIASIFMFHGAIEAQRGDDWLGGMRGPLALLVVPIAAFFPQLTAPWAATIFVAMGVLSVFAAIASFAISRQGARVLRRQP